MKATKTGDLYSQIRIEIRNSEREHLLVIETYINEPTTENGLPKCCHEDLKGFMDTNP